MNRLLQLALDLFDAPAPASAPPAPPAAPAPAAFPASTPSPAPAGVTPTGAPRVPTASAPAAPPAEPLSRVLEPVRFAHPRANRESLLEGTRVAYELRRARRRTIGFSVGAEGLTVSAPQWVTLREIEDALRHKSAWIVRKLAEMRDRDARLEGARIEWRDGAVLPFLGEDVIVVLDPRHGFEGGGVLHTDAQALPGVPRLTLHLGLSQQAGPVQIRDAAQAWLMRQARRLFTERLEHYAPQLGVRWTKLSLSSAATRWGTASADGAIRLNWRLVHFRLPVIDYVVVHELSHLRVMDHSPRFWETVGTVVPDYAALRAELRADPLPPW
ncbi:M48 family metallopeptidase [Ramlibacter sp. MAHUQ-53]|uniref:M48 family metallopeptidase n=1 Tax=unclassified Ramlibacter TaxID=2617605 RepID=UPI003638CF86